MIYDEYGQPNTYYLEWLDGKHQTDYNNCRFTEDKLTFAKNWLISKKPELDWNKPKNIVDIIARQKLRIITDDDYCKQLSVYADKVTCNSTLASWGIPEMLWPTYPIGDNIEQEIMKYRNCWMSKTIDFAKAWFKTNHGSGWNMAVHFGMMPDTPKFIANKLNEWKSLNYAYISGYERQYENITPKVIMQPHMCDSPIDYGFWCVNGEIEGISLTKKLGKNLEQYVAFVDKECKESKWYIGCKPSMGDLPMSMKKRIDEIIPTVEALAKINGTAFDFVRIDFNYVDGKWYFGEMTFTPCSGILDLGVR